MITDVPGVRVGHWTGEGTGVTVIRCPVGTTGAAEIRGGAPAERELAVLDPLRTVAQVDAVVFSGGSAFGLASADGVMTALAEEGRGYSTQAGPVPIVPTAAIFDLVASGGRYPEAPAGRAACAAATRDFATGRVGAGRGASVGMWRGPEYRAPGGLGSASAEVDGATVGVLAVVNAVGDVIAADGSMLAGSSAPPGTRAFPQALVGGEQTTLVCVATDANLSKVDCYLLAQSGHHGLARAIHPSHTRFDGDLVIALATGQVDAALDRLRVAVTDVVVEAVRAAVRPE